MPFTAVGFSPAKSIFGSPQLWMPKPDVMLHIYIDCHAVNAIMVNDRYTLPHIKGLLNSMYSSCWFTKLDLLAGYHSIYITIANRYKTTFTTKLRVYMSRLLQVGIVNVPSHLMHMINGILVPMKCKFIVIYFDNIIIYICALAECVTNA